VINVDNSLYYTSHNNLTPSLGVKNIIKITRINIESMGTANIKE